MKENRTCKTCQYYERNKCCFYLWHPKKGKGTIDKTENESCVYHEIRK